MHDEYEVESGVKTPDWTVVMNTVKNLLTTKDVVAVKRYVGGKYIATFYFTKAF